jgi:hypothetical protein
MTRISRTFTYDLADDYLAQTSELRKSASWTYNGPDRIWVFLDNETNKLYGTNFYTLEEDGPSIPSPLGCTKLEINCQANPLFCTLVGASDHVDGDALPKYSEDLPNGEVYTRPLNPMPDHTYEFNDAEYNPRTQQWSYPWKKTWVTWDDIRSVVASQLSQVETELRGLSDLPSSLRTMLETYKTELENFETTWAGIDAHKVWLPIHPINK